MPVIEVEHLTKRFGTVLAQELERLRGVDARVKDALADAAPTCFWLDNPAAPDPAPPLGEHTECDLAVIGAGLAGLWTALLAKERDPSCDVLVLEAGRVGWQASGRNGGFCMATITHNPWNGLDKFPDEIDVLQGLGHENLDEMRATVEERGIDCDWRSTGELAVAIEPYQADELREGCERLDQVGEPYELWDRDRIQAEIHSPRYEAAVWTKIDCAMVDPARLSWGVARLAREAGVRFCEGTPVIDLRRSGGTLALSTPAGAVRARQVVLATNAFKPLLRRLRLTVVPVYDHALMTEPLSEAQWRDVGWESRVGVSDVPNQFHYYRVSEDGRILWGGYDAVYHFANGIRPEFELRTATFAKLATHFYETFPQLEGLRFTHAWAGVIDTSTRFCPFYGTALGGRVAYALGYTGMGVGATRFAARVCLDLLSGEKTELTELRYAKSKPIPWPPEPLRWGAIAATTRSLDHADRNEGRRNAWLRTLDRLGVGFDS